MIEIRNNNKFPVQLIVRSKTAPRSFTTLNIPGIGGGKNVYHLNDEQSTEYIERAVKQFGMITTRYIPDHEIKKRGE
jgi:hypothetical protein